MSDCPFHALGLNPSASESEILKTWRRLELAHHPDKDTSTDAIEVSKRFNEAKDKAIRIVRRKHELEEHIRLLRHHTSEELNAPLNDDLRLGVYGMVGFLQQATRKYNPNPEIGGYFRLVKKLEDDRESARSEKDKAKRERDDAVARANELQRERDDAIAKTDELERERDNALSKLDELTREKDNAVTKLTHEKDDALSKMAELARERDNALLKVSQIEHIAPIIDHVAPSAKKRKHVKVYANQQDHESFKQAVSHFVQSNFKVSQDAPSVLTTKQILEMFTASGHDAANEPLFFKEIARALKHHFPTVVYKKLAGRSAYHGIAPNSSFQDH